MLRSISAPAPFRVVESRDSDHVLHMALVGELDLAVADQIHARLEQLSGDGTRVRLDLSKLEFIDSSGLRALIHAVQNGSRNGSQLVDIDRVTTHQVQNVIDLTGATPLLWPGR